MRGQIRFVALLAGVPVASVCLAQSKYTVQEIGFYPQQAIKIGNGGAATYKLGANSYIWEPGVGTTQINGIEATYGAAPHSVNSSSVVVGQDQSSTPRAFIWDKNSGTRVLYDFGHNSNGFINQSEAWSISDNGNVAGWYGRPFDPAGQMPFVYTNGQVKTLDKVDATQNSAAWAVNDAGQAAGNEESSQQGTSLGVFWHSNGTVVDMGHPLDTKQINVWGMNSKGQVCGVSNSSSHEYGFLWSEADGYTIIPNSIISQSYTNCYSVNSLGVAVGAMGNGAQRNTTAFVWDNQNGTHELSSLLDPSQTGWRLDIASGINDAGQIVGGGYHNGNAVAFVATPVVPEPCTLLVLAPVALLVRSRRKTALVQSAPTLNL